MKFLEELAVRRRFGMKPGLDAIRDICRRLGDPQLRFPAVHVAGTNGKGAVCAMLDAALRGDGGRIGRYTSPHLVMLNERFFLEGRPVDDETLDLVAAKVSAAATAPDVTFFEALTAVAFQLYAEADADMVVLETGLGGRLDATNVCAPRLCVITRIGLDHCDWLGSTVEQIAVEKAGIVKPGVPVVLGRNVASVRRVVEARAREVGAPFHYAPDLAEDTEIPPDFSLGGSFNRENAVTAIAALKVLNGDRAVSLSQLGQFSQVVWPGRFQSVGKFIVDGAHNPPAARALAEALSERLRGQVGGLNLIAGFCGDKDVEEVLRILKPFVTRGLAIRTNNPRTLSAEETAAKMAAVGIPSAACGSLISAIRQSEQSGGQTLICGSLFLAGEALVALGAYPWSVTPRFDQAELLSRTAFASA